MLNYNDFSKSPTLCPAPWTQVAIDTNRELRPCCFAKLGTKKERDFNSYWNSRYIQDIRTSMLKGEWHPACDRCQLIEQNAGLSKRHYETYLLKKRLSDQKELEIDGTPITRTPALCLEVRFGNLCNLKCRMCDPESSNKIADEYNFLNKMLDQELFPSTKTPRIQNSLQSLKKLLPPLESLRMIRILGGEPFLDKECKSFCQMLIEQQQAANISLIITTNLTCANDDWIEILKRFKHVTLQLSVDGTDKVIEYIRYGTSWNRLMKNLKKFLRDLPNARFLFAPCVQAYNLLSLDKVYTFCTQLKTAHPKHDILIFPSLLKSPQFLATNILSQTARKRAAQRLLPILKDDLFYDPEKQHLRSIIEHISNEETADIKMRLKWRSYTATLDTHRGQSLKSSIPELSHLLKAEDTIQGVTRLKNDKN